MANPTGPNEPGVSSAERPTTLIRPPRLLEPLNLRELFEYRYLIWTFALRNIKGKYKQSLLGFMWAPANPLIQAVLYAVLFGRVANLDQFKDNYVLFAYIAMLPWMIFSGMYKGSSNILLAQQNLIQKVYFPRLVLPFSFCITLSIELGIQFLIQLGMMAWFGIFPTWRILVLIPVLVFTMLLGLGVGTLVASLSVRYRDVANVGTVIVQLWQFATPIAYPMEAVEKNLPWAVPLLKLNPLYLPVQLARWAALPDEQIAPGPYSLASTLIAIAIIFVGLYMFRRTEQTVADIL